MKEPLTDIEYDILDSLYFVEPFDTLLSECKYPANIIADVLKQLLSKKYVTAMLFDEHKQDYTKSFIYDSDDMRAYSYLATKDGLMAHNTR